MEAELTTLKQTILLNISMLTNLGIGSRLGVQINWYFCSNEEEI